MMHPILLDGAVGARVALVADHASNHVPDGIDLGIEPALLMDHIAWDIGTDPLTRRLAARLGAPAVIAGVSRLVIDLNRELDAHGLIPATSDGHDIRANQRLTADERQRRIAVYHAPYHAAVERMIDLCRPALLVGIHSFTPQLSSRPDHARPWPVGILYNGDARAARPAIDWLSGQGLNVGDNEPYSGRLLNYTMNRHAEARGLPYLGIEIRQDELADTCRVEEWVDRLAGTIRATLDVLDAGTGPSGSAATAAS